MGKTEKVWRKNFADAARAIHPGWLRRYEDGLYILPEYKDRPEAVLYRKLCVVGAARGWL